ncbi:uncharacterized protein LOC111372832 [Olea europaea var. sylvestris]|uniref:uncharacterized protein LOC111372832 n=1 Tax=Olea europaea var. sylvestris TaxID=158386 RepID=UPI000C1D3B00|nr:uncharacterized protein LOC111372832 [Olea europaea var. sylvestris]
MPRMELKPGMIQLLPTFHGLDSENPYVHIREFEEVVATFHNQHGTTDAARLKFFSFSLKEKAKTWLYLLRPRSIGTWAEMTQAFFNKYFPHHKTSALKKQISSFTQKDSETLYQAWERFKELQALCPHHGYESWRIVSYFYEGLTPRERQFVEMMCNGDFLQKDPDEAIEYLDDLAEKAHTWTGPSPTDSTNRSRPPRNPTSTGIYQLRKEDSLKAKVEALTKEFETLRAKGSKPAQTVSRVESLGPCFVCGGVDHLAQECTTLFEMRGVYEEHCNALGTYRKPYSPFSESYNPGWHNHPNLSWKSENQQTTQSNRTYSAPSYQPTPSRNSLEDTLHAFIEAQGKANQKFETMINQVVEENKEIKNHVSKLTDALTVGERGKFPAQAQSNPKGQHMAQTSDSGESNLKEANVITTRSGKVIEPISKLRENEKESSESEESSPSDEAVGNPSRVPFPQAFKLSPKSVNQHNEILEHLRQVQINLPLLHVISQVPTYAKVLKDLCTVKRKHIVKKTAFLTEQVSAVIEQRIPPKYKDPGCPIVSCVIGNHEFAEALLDLGASVNLMPHSIYLLLGLGEIKPTSVALQLADRSTIRPRGVVEDVLVQIDKFYYPVDFLVLDVKVDVNVDSKIPIILGRLSSPQLTPL